MKTAALLLVAAVVAGSVWVLFLLFSVASHFSGLLPLM
jgi:hypothetical protein